MHYKTISLNKGETMEPEKKSAMDEFFGDIPKTDEQDPFKEVVVEPAKEEAIEEIEAKPRDNREARRAKAALQAERENNIALSARLQALTEAQKFSQDLKNPIEDEVALIFSTDEVGQLGAKRLSGILQKVQQEATDRALETFRGEQAKATAEVSNQEKVLDTMLEEVEDEFDVDLTSNAPAARKARQEFFSILEKVSPKDSEGNVKDFADPIATWELYQSKKPKEDNNRAKDLSARSMVRSGASSEVKLEQTATERWLKDHIF